MLASSFSLFSLWKAISSLVSFTKAFTTAMPEKDSWEKSDREEKAAWRVCQRFCRDFPTTVLTASRKPMGIRDKSIMGRFTPAILISAKPPKNKASQKERMPEPKQSCTVSRSLVNRDISPPTLFTW